MLQKYSVPGNSNCIVHRDTVILKGYGRLGFDLNEQWNARQTPVFVASLSKLFTATGLSNFTSKIEYP